MADQELTNDKEKHKFTSIKLSSTEGKASKTTDTVVEIKQSKGPKTHESSLLVSSDIKTSAHMLTEDEELDFTSPKFNPFKALNVHTSKNAEHASNTAVEIKPNKDSKSSNRFLVPLFGVQQTADKSVKKYPDLEIASPKFDPLKALYSSTLPKSGKSSQKDESKHTVKSSVAVPVGVPGSSTKVKETSKERRMRKLRQEKKQYEDYIEKKKTELLTGETNENVKDSVLVTTLNARKGKERNVFTRMRKMIGPLQVLTRCVAEKLLVRVFIRGAVTLKSIYRGYVVAFDKQFNMALVDAVEIYRRPFALGKIKAQRSHKLRSAQKVLHEEKDLLKAQRAREEADCLPGAETHCEMDDKQETDRNHTKAPASLEPTTSVTSVKKSEILDSSRSVYEGRKKAYSLYEREALMLGVADENIEIRHINQVFIRGENVVSVSIVENIQTC